MPKDFDRCVSENGRVRTKTLQGGKKYLHICYDSAGKSHAGHVRTAKYSLQKKKKKNKKKK